MKNTFKVGDKVKYVCTKGETVHLTIGKTYIVNAVPDSYWIQVLSDRNISDQYRSYRFELVEDNSLEDRIEKAKSLIGKMISNHQDDIFTPDSWAIGNKYGDHFRDGLDENGLVVYVENNDYICKVEDAKIVTNVIKLNDTYDAKIEEHIVQVGCQEIPIEKVREIISTWEKLHG